MVETIQNSEEFLMLHQHLPGIIINNLGRITAREEAGWKLKFAFKFPCFVGLVLKGKVNL